MLKKASKWYIRFRRVPDGRWMQKVSGADRKVAALHEAKMRLEWQTYVATGVVPATQVDPQPLTFHVKPYLEHMESRVGERRLRLIETRLQAVLDDGRELDAILRDLLRTKSAATVDDYGRIVMAFGRWLAEARGVPTNPFRQPRPFSGRGTQTFERMALTMDDVRRLAEAAPSRALLYLTAATTGMRAGELRALEWRHIRNGAVALPGHLTKSKTSASIPLQGWVSDMLERVRGLPLARVFEDDFGAAVIRGDAGLANLEVEPHRRLDFHCLRTSCATILLTQGVPPDAVQEIMRHASFVTTARHYRRVTREALARQVQIPDPRGVAR